MIEGGSVIGRAEPQSQVLPGRLQVVMRHSMIVLVRISRDSSLLVPTRVGTFYRSVIDMQRVPTYRPTVYSPLSPQPINHGSRPRARARPAGAALIEPPACSHVPRGPAGRVRLFASTYRLFLCLHMCVLHSILQADCSYHGRFESPHPPPSPSPKARMR